VLDSYLITRHLVTLIKNWAMNIFIETSQIWHPYASWQNFQGKLDSSFNCGTIISLPGTNWDFGHVCIYRNSLYNTSTVSVPKKIRNNGTRHGDAWTFLNYWTSRFAEWELQPWSFSSQFCVYDKSVLPGTVFRNNRRSDWSVGPFDNYSFFYFLFGGVGLNPH
jgi:hypothetical protein